MDAPAVRAAAGEALSALKQAQSIKLHLTKASDGVAEAREGVESMAETSGSGWSGSRGWSPRPPRRTEE